MNINNHIQITQWALRNGPYGFTLPETLVHNISMYCVWPDLKDSGFNRLYFHSYVPGLSDVVPLIGSADRRIADIIEKINPPTAYSLGIMSHYLEDMSQPFHTSLYELLPTQRLHRTFEDDLEEDFPDIIKVISGWTVVQPPIVSPVVLAREAAKNSSRVAEQLVYNMTRMSYGLNDVETEKDYNMILQRVTYDAIQYEIRLFRWAFSLIAHDKIVAGGPLDFDPNRKRIWARARKFLVG